MCSWLNIKQFNRSRFPVPPIVNITWERYFALKRAKVPYPFPFKLGKVWEGSGKLGIGKVSTKALSDTFPPACPVGQRAGMVLYWRPIDKAGPTERGISCDEIGVNLAKCWRPL